MVNLNHVQYIAGVDYIEFFDLDGTEDVKNVVPDNLGLNTSDYFSEPIFVNSGIPIGARAELTTELYVSRRYSMH